VSLQAAAVVLNTDIFVFGALRGVPLYCSIPLRRWTCGRRKAAAPTWWFHLQGGSAAECLACWTQAQKARVQIAVATLSGNSLRQTVHTRCASVYQAAELVGALSRVAGVTVGLAESNGSLAPGFWLTSPAGWLPRTGISSGTLRSVIEYGLPLPFFTYMVLR